MCLQYSEKYEILYKRLLIFTSIQGLRIYGKETMPLLLFSLDKIKLYVTHVYFHMFSCTILYEDVLFRDITNYSVKYTFFLQDEYRLELFNTPHAKITFSPLSYHGCLSNLLLYCKLRVRNSLQ